MSDSTDHQPAATWAVVDSLEGEVAGPMTWADAERWISDNGSYFVGTLTIEPAPPEPEDAPEDEDEPYCTGCGEWVGMFIGMDGWHHYRGDPRPGGERELFAAGHEASVAWRPVPSAPSGGDAE